MVRHVLAAGALLGLWLATPAPAHAVYCMYHAITPQGERLGHGPPWNRTVRGAANGPTVDAACAKARHQCGRRLARALRRGAGTARGARCARAAEVS